MSLLDTLEHLVDDRDEVTFARVMNSARDAASDHLNGPEADLAKRALDKIEEQGPNLLHLGRGGLISLLARTALGEPEQAKLTYLAEGASFEERRAASHAATALTVTERVDRERAWEEVQEMLKDIGNMAWKVLPLLLVA